MANRKDKTNEALAIWNALLPKIKAEMERRMGACVKRKRATVIVAPHTDANGNRVMTVQEPYGSSFDVPYNPALENQALGTSVWLEWSYSASNMVAVAEGNGTFPASGGGGGTGDMLKSVYDPNNYSQDIFTYADNAAYAVSVYWCTYGTTTNAQIATALSANRLVAMKYNNLVYIMAYTNSATHHEFISVRGDNIYTASVDNNTWVNGYSTYQQQIVINGILKGDGLGNVSSATVDVDYQSPLPSQTGHSGEFLTTDGSSMSWGTPAGSGTIDQTTEVLKGDGNGNAVAAIAGTDYQAPLTAGTDYLEPPALPSDGDVLTYNSGSWDAAAPPVTSVNGNTGDVTLTAADVGAQPDIMVSGIIKGDGAGNLSAATAGTDYIAPPASPNSGDVLTWSGSAWAADAPDKDIYYGVCLSLGTQTQSVTISGITSLYDGLSIRVYFNNPFTYNGSAKLNLNSLGAKSIVYNDETAVIRYAWAADSVFDLVYDSSLDAWVIVGSTQASTDRPGIVQLTNSYASHSTSTAATPAAVKAAYDLAAGKQDPLPSQTGQSGKFLTTDGTNLSWASAGGGSGTIEATTNILKGDGAGNAIAATEEQVSSLSIDNTPTLNSTNLVTSGGVYAAIQGGGSAVYTDSVTLSATWSGSGPYTQTVTLANYTVTSNTKVDIQPDSTTIAQLITDSVKALYIANNSGTLTAYAIGAAPSTSLTMQVTCAEVTSA